MIEERYPFLEQFIKLVIPWADEVLQWGPDDGLAGFEAIETPWYSEHPAGHMTFHLKVTVEFCERVVELVSQLAAEPPLNADSLENVLLAISPFNFGPLVEIRYMAYHFGPLYLNIMTKFLKYRGEQELAKAHASKLFWTDDVPNVTAIPTTKIMTLTRELSRKGRLNPKETRELALRLLKVRQCAQAVLIWAKCCEQYVKEPPWVGIIAFQAISHDLQSKLVQFEALWGMYECSWWYGRNGRKQPKKFAANQSSKRLQVIRRRRQIPLEGGANTLNKYS